MGSPFPCTIPESRGHVLPWYIGCLIGNFRPIVNDSLLCQLLHSSSFAANVRVIVGL